MEMEGVSVAMTVVVSGDPVDTEAMFWEEFWRGL